MTEPHRPLAPRCAWLLIASTALIAPLLLAAQGGWEAQRGFVAELGSSLGIVALGVLALVLILPARLRLFAALGADTSVRLHRRLATVLLALIAAHVVVAIAAEPARLALLRVTGDPWRAKAAIGSTAALLLLPASARLRRPLRVPYAAWRALHVLLATAALVLAIAHVVGWQRYLSSGVGVVAVAGLTLPALAALGSLRVRRRRTLLRAPYVVESVRPERGDAVTVQLRADGHAGHRFGPGQFAWLKPADEPLGIVEHPFSYASSAEHPDRPSFTIRSCRGFTRAARDLAPGTRLLIDGPHGAYRRSPRSRGLLLIANGIGITPCMSILRTAADQRDPRHVVLIYANRTPQDITFAEELKALEGQLDLDVVHTLSRAAPDWKGARGRVCAPLLAAHLPRDLRAWEFFLCGSGAAVDGSLLALQQLGIPPECVHAERFVEV